MHKINKAEEKDSSKWILPVHFYLCQWCHQLWKNVWDLNIMGVCKKNWRPFQQLFCAGRAGSPECFYISSWDTMDC